jgi:hypothetical protein
MKISPGERELARLERIGQFRAARDVAISRCSGYTSTTAGERLCSAPFGLRVALSRLDPRVPSVSPLVESQEQMSSRRSLTAVSDFTQPRAWRERLTRLVSSSRDPQMKLMEFTDGDRTFVCRAESSPATPGTLWWWMSVTGESARYAAFRAESGDTERELRPRILAYYAQLLADRARPALFKMHWAQRRAATNAPETGGAIAGAPGDSPVMAPV